MYRLKRNVLTSLFVLLAACTPTDRNQESEMSGNSSGSPVIEIVTLKLKDGVSYPDFALIDNAVETEHVSRQPGFIYREVAAGEDGEWLVIVHWESAQDANASMSTFMEAPAANDFMNNIDASTMVMNRYSKLN